MSRGAIIFLLSGLSCLAWPFQQLPGPPERYLSLQDAVRDLMTRSASACTVIQNSSTSLIGPGNFFALDLENLVPRLQKQLQADYSSLQRLVREDCIRLNKRVLGETYWDYTAALSSVRAAQMTSQVFDRIFQQGRDRFQAGDITQFELQRLEAERTLGQQDLELAKHDALIAEEKLRNLTGRLHKPGADNDSLVPVDRVTIPAQEPVESPDDLLAIAVRNRSDYLFQSLWLTKTQPDESRRKTQLQVAEQTIRGEITVSLAALANDRRYYELSEIWRKESEIGTQFLPSLAAGYNRGAIPLNELVEVLRAYRTSQTGQVKAERVYAGDILSLECAIGTSLK